MSVKITRRDFLMKGASGIALGAAYPQIAAFAAPSQVDQIHEKYMGDEVMETDDVYIRRKGTEWRFGTSKVERTVVLEDGCFYLKSFRNRASGMELAPEGMASDEFCLTVNGHSLSGAARGWTLLASSTRKLKHGERRLALTLQREGLELTKNFLVYPGVGVIREWLTIRNVRNDALVVENPSFLRVGFRMDSPENLDFQWITGGENQPGCWDLRTEKLTSGKPRTFDSYEPFPFKYPNASPYPGDGTRSKILLNDRQIFPDTGWAYSPNASVTIPFNVETEIHKGDHLVFLVNMNHNIGWDTTAFDPSIVYSDGETHIASKEFSGVQGEKGWRYQYLENGKFIDLVYYPAHQQWRKAVDNATGTPFIGAGTQHPDVDQDAARVWTAPHDGLVRIMGSICNIGNTAMANLNFGFRPGSGSYAPWCAFFDEKSKQGLFIGWDYFGHWTSSHLLQEQGSVISQLQLAGFKQTLRPGERMETPKAFIGLYEEDLDNAGNECLDWQYRYLWDYTREGWFPATRLLGYWYKGTIWGKPGTNWLGGDPDWGSDFRKVFRVADLMREVGGDVYHRDWGWWDRAGDWNGPDFRSINNYLQKYGMGLLIYAFLYTVDPKSRVGRIHPDWLIGDTLDMSIPEVVRFISRQLDGFVRRWGAFEWRNDSFFTAQRKGDDTPELGQDQGFREILRGFLDRHPDCAFQAVNGGGNYGGVDYAHYASTLSFSDGAVGILRNYYASLLFPPDKTSDNPDGWNPDHYDKSLWRGLLCINFDMTGDTWDPDKLEGIRELVDIYHFLLHEGVAGRWVKVFRPKVQGDDPTMYFQRLSGDRLRGVIIPKRPAHGNVTIYPKGLLPNESYFVSFQESSHYEERAGADLMQKGIPFEIMSAGELIYLNLPYHPGNHLDDVPPSIPTNPEVRKAENMGYPGVEFRWGASTDDHWLSHYEILRNDVMIDEVAKGTYYFDHSCGADLGAKYGVRAVDGAGNRSDISNAPSVRGKPALIYDDQDRELTYMGVWRREIGLQPAYMGTLTSSSEKGATMELFFEGDSVLLFSKLGADCGIAAVSVDKADPVMVDTYSADDIWGVCVYQRKLNTGHHHLSVTVTGKQSERSAGAKVHIDGIRVE
jgi:hypothetical protein